MHDDHHDDDTPSDGTRMLDGRFVLGRVLGEGGVGVVYEGRQVSTGQRVAIKVVRPERLAAARDAGVELERFRRELDAIARLRHPNIVQLVDQGHTPDGVLYAVLGFIEGESLSAALERHGALEIGEARQIMAQVLDALGYAHAHGIVHRDLKPHNIMLTRGTGRRRHAMVVDFGIATLHGAGAEARTQLTGAGQFPGTPAYMAPEQLRGEPITPAVDLYAWGLTFIEALTARPAVSGSSIAAVIFRHMCDDPIALPPFVRDTPLGAILARACAKDPAQRYATASQALADLEADAHSSALSSLIAPNTGELGVSLDALAVTGGAMYAPQDPAASLAHTLDALSPVPAPSPHHAEATAHARDDDSASAARDGASLSSALAGTLDAARVSAALDAANAPTVAAADPSPSPPAQSATDGPHRRARLLIATLVAGGAVVAIVAWIVVASLGGERATDSLPASDTAAALEAPDATAPETTDVAPAGDAQPSPPAPLPDASHLAAGALAGAMASVFPAPPLRIVELAASRWTSCALLSDGRVRCWGDGRGHAFGTAHSAEAWAPVEVEGLPPMRTLYVGSGSDNSLQRTIFCGRAVDQDVWCWGDNRFGGFGSGGRDSTPAPRKVPLLAGLSAIACRSAHTCAILDSHIACWGVNNMGVLGNGLDGGESVVPMRVAEPTDPPFATPARAVAVTKSASCALDDDGATWCWGFNHGDVFGPAYREPQRSPVRLDHLPPLQTLAASSGAVCGITRDAPHVICWGFGFSGVVDLPDTTGMVALAAQSDSMCGLDLEGTLSCWSMNLLDDHTPARVALPAPARLITAGVHHTCALLEDGKSVYCLGRNDRGQLGDGTAVDRASPVAVSGILADPLPAPPTAPSALPVAATRVPVPPPSLPPALCAADAALETASAPLEVRSSWLVAEPRGRSNVLVIADYVVEPAAVREPPRGSQRRVVLTLPALSGAAPGSLSTADHRLHIRDETGVEPDEHIAFGASATGAVSVDYLDEEWACGSIDVASQEHFVRGRFVAARVQ